MNEEWLRGQIANRLSGLSADKKTPQSGIKKDGIHIAQQRISDWGKTVTLPGQWLSLRVLAQWYEVSEDYILSLTDDPTPKPKRDLSPDERSIFDIMKELPPHKREEVIQLAEVVLRMHRKEETEDSKPSLYDRAKEKYESGENAPRIIGQNEDDPQNEE